MTGSTILLGEVEGNLELETNFQKCLDLSLHEGCVLIWNQTGA